MIRDALNDEDLLEVRKALSELPPEEYTTGRISGTPPSPAQAGLLTSVIFDAAPIGERPLDLAPVLE